MSKTVSVQKKERKMNLMIASIDMWMMGCAEIDRKILIVLFLIELVLKTSYNLFKYMARFV